jgi:hypothetical protein
VRDVDEETVEIQVREDTLRRLEEEANVRGVSVQEFLERLLLIDKKEGLQEAST